MWQIFGGTDIRDHSLDTDRYADRYTDREADKQTEELLYRLTGSAVGRISIAPGFKPRLGYFRRVFHLSLRLITFGGRSAHLAYLVQKSGRKTTTFIHRHTHTHIFASLT